MKMPAVSQAQILAFIAWVVSQAVAYGALDSKSSQVVLSIAATIVAAAWKIADSWRHSANATVKAAAIASPNDTAAELQKANTG